MGGHRAERSAIGAIAGPGTAGFTIVTPASRDGSGYTDGWVGAADTIRFNWPSRSSGLISIVALRPGSSIIEATFGRGNSPALVEVQGDVTFGDNNTLVIELAGTSPGTGYDRLQVGNEVTLGGSLRFDLLDGFIPAAGDVYTFLIAGGGLFGDFSSIVLPILSGLSFNIDRDANSLSLAVSATPIPLPAGIWLLGSALCACFGLARRRVPI